MYCYHEYLSIATPTLTPTNFKNRPYERKENSKLESLPIYIL